MSVLDEYATGGGASLRLNRKPKGDQLESSRVLEVERSSFEHHAIAKQPAP
jgi:hypothetical protein